MRALFTCLIALLTTSSIFAQQPAITVKVVGGENNTLTYFLPVEGRYFIEAPKEDTLDAKGELVLPNTESVAGVYLFVYMGAYRLYVEPGQSYKLTIDRRNKEKPVQVEGPEQEAELALLQLKWEFSQTVGAAMYRQDSVFANNKQQVMHLRDSCMQPFDQLFKQHQMSKPFYAYTKALVNNYYGAVLASTLIQPIRGAVYSKDSVGYDAVALRRLDDQVQESMKMINLSDPATLVTDTYQEFSFFYWYMYLGYHWPQMRGTFKGKKNDNREYIFYGIEENITKEPAREYCIANYLQSLIFENKFEFFIPDLYREFVGQYPRSRYIKILAGGIEKIKNFDVLAKKDLTPEQRLVTNYDSIASIDELLSRFKDKVIYIDLWATWCGPCKEQFEYKKEIDPFLKSKGVNVLYISLDRASDKQKWVNMIKYYNLEGDHVLASEKLADDIYKRFGKNMSLMIPRYVICKDGKVIQKDAKRPQDKDALIKQIESVL